MKCSEYSIIQILEMHNTKNKANLSISCTPGKYKGSVITDINKIVAQNYNIVVCLLTWYELEQLHMLDYPEILQSKGITFLHLPVLDGNIPTMNEMNPVIKKLVYKLLIGKNILIHCRCGYGRAGTLAACILLHFNYDSNEAIALVRDRRHGAIQTKTQEIFINQYEKYLTE